MLYQTIASDNAAQIAEELGRARRVCQSLNNEADLRIVEAYIAELEARQSGRAQRFMRTR